MSEPSKKPVVDVAEHNAWFPSPLSMTQYVVKKTDYAGTKFSAPYKKGDIKVLMIGTEERYLLMGNGTMFSTGNHPVETLLPVHHIDAAGFEFDIATLGGNPVKFEMWAMPSEDDTVKKIFQKYLPKLKQPMKLSDVIETKLGPKSPYGAVLIPGGHGVMSGVPQSKEVKQVLKWAMDNDKLIITLCHGPAALVAGAIGEKDDNFLFKGYSMCVFPDSLDIGLNIDIGYTPGPMPWLVCKRLEELGVKILNKDITGKVHQDRNLLSGDSPLASNNLGILAADAMLKKYAK